jgi:hypothetical protein
LRPIRGKYNLKLILIVIPLLDKLLDYRKIHEHSWKEHNKFSQIVKFGYEILSDTATVIGEVQEF